MNDKLTYREGKLGRIMVYLGRGKIGEIRPIPGNAYQYVTKAGHRGEPFYSIAQVKQSLEAQ